MCGNMLRTKNGLEVTLVEHKTDKYMAGWAKVPGRRNIPHANHVYYRDSGKEIFCNHIGRDGCCCLADYSE
jgi:hypothetical protein